MTFQNQPPFFSIVLPTYNRAHMVAVAVQSVLDQNFADWELIIVDDGSTDSTQLSLNPFLSDSRINYYYQENQERSAARNKGIEKSRGKYICFLDSDDYYLSHHLQSLYNSIETHQHRPALYYTLCEFNLNGKIKKPKPLGKLMGNGLYNVLNNSLLLTNSVCVSSELLRSDRFPQHLHMFEDNHLWLRIICKSELIMVNELTNIVIEHEQRSLNYAAKELDKKAEKYMHAINDLLYSGKYPEINQCITNDQKRGFIASKYIVMAYEALNLYSAALVYKYVSKSVRTRIEFKNIKSLFKLFFFSWIYIAVKSIKK